MKIFRHKFFAAIGLAALLATGPAQGAEVDGGDGGVVVAMTAIAGQSMDDADDPGTALEITREGARRAGIALTERFLPWTRALKMIEGSRRAIIVPFSRTPPRERHFTWIAELYDLQFGFVSRGTAVDDMAAARKLGRIGVWRSSSMQDELMRQGFKNVVPVSDDDALERMLINGRIDAWYGSLNEAAYKFRGVDEIDRAGLKFGAPIHRQPVWIAARADFPPALARRLSQAVESMRRDGAIRHILARYGFAAGGDAE